METDVDCGGPQCSATGVMCALTEACAVDGDCESGICITSVAAPVCISCGDGLKNGGETDVDCGGARCGPCADTKGCSAESDCQSKQGTAPIAGCSGHFDIASDNAYALYFNGQHRANANGGRANVRGCGAARNHEPATRAPAATGSRSTAMPSTCSSGA